jgi:superfamily II DNA or RNA helicase
MPLSCTKRVYSGKALEHWFRQLQRNWEELFRSYDLEAGRQLYRSGCVKEIELAPGDAIVRGRDGDDDYYVVLDWHKGELEVRVSHPRADMGYPLAVAGLYEIEELVADETPAVTPDDAEEAPDAQDAEEEVKPEPKTDEKVEQTAVTRRILELDIVPEEGYLVCRPFWVEGSKRVSALPGNGEKSTVKVSDERISLIQFASLVRKSQFVLNPECRGYVLEDPTAISGFVKRGLPEWQKKFQVKVDPRVEFLKEGIQRLQIEAWATPADDGQIRIDWSMKVRGRELTALERFKLLNQGKGFLLLPDLGLVKVPEERLDAVVEWMQLSNNKNSAILPKYLLLSLFREKQLDISLSPELAQWSTRLESSELPDRELPDILRPYQKKGVLWLHHLCDHECHALLADEMGLGKTLQTITLLTTRPVIGKPSLIVCPASVVYVWQQEFARFAPEREIRVLKSGEDILAEAEQSVIWVASYTQLRRHRSLLDKVQFGYAVLDEGQLIKNPHAKVTLACWNIRADHRIVLTGTPVENRALDVWTLFRFLMPGLLGSKKKFEQNLQDDPDRTLRRLRWQIAPFVLRRNKRDVVRELPDKVEMDLICPLTPVQREEYLRISQEGLRQLGDNLPSTLKERSMSFFTLLTRLRQVCCDPALLPWNNEQEFHSGKLSMLLEKIQELTSGHHKVVIFSQFVSLLDRVKLMLNQHMKGLPIWMLTGKTTDRSRPVREFQSSQGSGVILVSLRAGGTGISLQSADYVFILDPWWNPAVEDQAVDRVHRIGQTNNVFVYRMVTQGTVEDRIQRLKAEKRELFDQVVGGFSPEFDPARLFGKLSALIGLSEYSEGESMEDI